MSIGLPMPLLPGTLDVLVLKAATWQPQHGYGIARLIEARSEGGLRIEDGALYQALHRLQKQGALTSDWGVSDNGRRARYYTITDQGRERLAKDVSAWRRYTQAVGFVLETA